MLSNCLEFELFYWNAIIMTPIKQTFESEMAFYLFFVRSTKKDHFLMLDRFEGFKSYDLAFLRIFVNVLRKN